MNKLLSHFIGLFLMVTSLSAQTKEDTHVIRAAIDIGMGGPKLQVAEVALETNKIVRVLHSQRFFVNFYESVSKDPDNQLSSHAMDQGLEAFKNAVNVARSYNVDGIVAIATASFRSASNGVDYAKVLQAESGVPVHIVDQALEGKLAFQAVLSKVDVEAENLIVWDIGGGSIQFIGMTASDYAVDCGNQGVGSFNDYIIESIQHKDFHICNTPNPLSADEIIQAEAYARKLSQKVDKNIREKINCSSTIVMGAGSVFGYGIAAMVAGKNPFSLEDLAAVTSDLTGKTDADLGGGDFAFCEGTNVILALGYMKELGIKQMHIIHANNADGAMLYGPFWE